MSNRWTIAEDLADYLKENAAVCAIGNTQGYLWIRYWEGEWRLAKYGGQHRLRAYVDGLVVDRDATVEWLVSNPVELIPAAEAYLWGPSKTTIWEDATAQDVFEDVDRCYWCGKSDRTVVLDRYETTEQGECIFCSDCYKSWDRYGEIVGTADPRPELRSDGGTLEHPRKTPDADEFPELDERTAAAIAKFERFVVGSPGTSRSFHKLYCGRVSAALKQHQYSKGRKVSRATKVSDYTIEIANLGYCELCEELEAEKR
ncbi:hypothetical protein [Natronocalculus amylovorans]|uniref:Uncharacterized protein n=1 Tax=Natronocalculus amylovorans TaxID=2917812 RepID=A0AAE3FZU1_9EURY|nr:hypothetical protein [Natronocalculus amylovorans]MCL9818364.1 hypothetical protein [Natronocalculus amylovorans]